MHIFTEPDRTIYPDNFQSTKCSGLEHLTGADMVISKLPIPPTVNLQAHIDNRALFVQIKIDDDNTSFEQIHRFVARVQAAKIPKNQAILLRIGKKWFDKFQSKEELKYGKTTWQQYRRFMMSNSLKGITFFPEILSTIDDLPEWITDYSEVISNLESDKDIYPERGQFVLDDIWQNVEEIKDWRRWLVSGLDGCGSKTAQSVMEYAEKTIPKHQFSAYHVLCLMTDEDDKGKPFHKIPGWGDKSRRSFRELLGLTPGWNLGELTYHYAYWQGWQAFGRDFADLVNKKKTPKEAHTQLMCKDFISIENEIPF